MTQKDFITAHIDVRKMILSALIGTFLISIYNIQTSGVNNYNFWSLIGDTILIMIIAFDYQKYLNQLKDLP